jgi:hypothetical protein
MMVCFSVIQRRFSREIFAVCRREAAGNARQRSDIESASERCHAAEATV